MASVTERQLPAGRLPGRVHVVGTGLIGTSLAMVLVRAGVSVSLADASPTSAALAADLSGGTVADSNEGVELVVVATPPDVTGTVVAHALRDCPGAYVTDVASVKSAVRADIAAAGVADLSRYVGGHPMAGRERSGAIAARIDLFEGRPWVIAVAPDTDLEGVALVRGIAEAAGAAVRALSAQEHDAAVAVVSHVPQVAASLVAARLEHLSEDAVGLAGPGVRDVTRIAASDPRLWTQILRGNAGAVATVLRELHTDLGAVIAALEGISGTGAVQGGAAGSTAVLAGALAAGNAGRDRIPGKHGAAPTTYRTVVVLVPDEPGQLGRVFHDVGEAGINLEEINLEHAMGAPFGLLELSVMPAVAGELAQELTRRGWRIHA